MIFILKTLTSKVDTSLEILEVRPEDAGTYFCNVETYGEPLDQAHTLDVLVPPSVQVRLLHFFLHHLDCYHLIRPSPPMGNLSSALGRRSPWSAEHRETQCQGWPGLDR